MTTILTKIDQYLNEDIQTGTQKAVEATAKKFGYKKKKDWQMIHGGDHASATFKHKEGHGFTYHAGVDSGDNAFHHKSGGSTTREEYGSSAAPSELHSHLKHIHHGGKDTSGGSNAGPGWRPKVK